MTKLQLIKPSAMVQMVNVFTRLERIAYNYLIHRARKSQNDGPWEVPMSELEDVLGVGRNNRPFLMDMLASLVSYPVTYDVLGKDGSQVWKSHATLFAQLSFSLDGTMIRYEFASGIMQYIREPQMYAKFDITEQMSIKSSAAVALHEYFHDVLGGKRTEHTQRVTIDAIRQLLGWTEKYTAFKEFSRQLNLAVEQVNRVGQLKVELKLNKRGRTPVDYTVTLVKSQTPAEAMAMIKDILR